MVSPTGKSFLFVRACDAQWLCLVRIGRDSMGLDFPLSLFLDHFFPLPLWEVNLYKFNGTSVKNVNNYVNISKSM